LQKRNRRKAWALSSKSERIERAVKAYVSSALAMFLVLERAVKKGRAGLRN